MSLRDEAMALIEQAKAKLEEAGIKEQLLPIAKRVADKGLEWGSTADDDYHWAESFQCSVCGDGFHSATLYIKKPKNDVNFQYALSIELCRQYTRQQFPRWYFLKYLIRQFWVIWREREEVSDVVISEDDLTRWKDLAKKL